MMRIVMDIAEILLAFLCSNLLYRIIRGYPLSGDYGWMYIVFTMVFVMTMFIQRMYNLTTFYYLDRIIQKAIISSVVSALCVSTVVFMSKSEYISRLFFLLFCVTGMSSVILGRLLQRWFFRERIGNGYTHQLFIGDGETMSEYLRFVGKTAMKIKIDRHIEFDNPALKSMSRFEELLKYLLIDEVIVSYSGNDPNGKIKELMSVCEEMGITVRLILELFDLPNSKRYVSSIGTYPVLTYHSVSLNRLKLFIKSAIDIAGAVVGLVLFSPVFLVTAIAIRLESPGPVLFAQTRIGKNGKPFKMYKFRSMYNDAEERKKELMRHNQVKGDYMFKMENDPRVTRVGAFIRKTSIDELPQLINVLMRNMSLVGTRPPTQDEVARYNRDHWRRISIKPGITGMWQTCGRSDILDFDEVVSLDKEYIDNWSLMLDVRLILKTFSAVVRRKGAR